MSALRPRRRDRRPGSRLATLLAAVALLVAGCGVAAPSAAPPSSASPAASGSSGASPAVLSPEEIAAAITEDGIARDLAMLGSAGEAATGYRSLGSPGYDAAVAKVEQILRDAGWSVREDGFTTTAFVDDGRSTLSIGDQSFGATDIRPLIYSPAGEAAGPLVELIESGASVPAGLGCDVADYGTLPAHAIVVVGRDDCYRRVSVQSAQEAGAAGFIAVVAGPPGSPPLRPTLISPDGLTIPAVSVSTAVVDAIHKAAVAHGEARITSTARVRDTATRSVIAELPGAASDRVVMLGAHLDSVIDGPGVNDDGSGVAALLGIARALSGTRPASTIRIALWTGEEEGLLGSANYVSTVGRGELDKIVAYLNADMVGSPNGYAGVYDESGSPSGSASIGALLEAAVTRLGATPVGADTGGGSDHAPFMRADVPVGGLFSGTSEPLSTDQAASFAGVAGRGADVCYHLACDDTSNVNLRLAHLLTSALADTAVRIAENPALVVR